MKALKILPVELIREADQFTIENEPIAPIDLMERAANQCFQWILRHTPVDQPIAIFAGTGNNGGDGLAIARLLSTRSYAVTVHVTGQAKKLSPSCLINFEKLQQMPLVHLCPCESEEQFPLLDSGELVIDAIFGSGLTRPVSGFYAQLIHHINTAKNQVVSLDVPSGLFIDHSMFGSLNPVVIHANYTLTFSPPKRAFFFPENDPFIGQWELLDIGLSDTFIASVDVSDFMVTHVTVKPLLHPRKRYAHKGDFGHGLLIAGSKGKIGASVLAAEACLRSGTGLVTVCTPASGVSILQTAIPEAMLTIDSDENIFSTLPPLHPYSAIGIGPGIGMDHATQNAFKLLIQEGRPLVIDADALNILGENKTWLSFLPKNCILTPHPKEFERIADKCSDNFERNRLQRELSLKYHCFIVLKGAHTAITTPDGCCFFNTTGNPGMATAGSGDVLTGMITGLLAQHYSPLEACLTGVYLHGLAGDLAVNARGEEALIARDIIEHIGNAFITVYGKF